LGTVPGILVTVRSLDQGIQSVKGKVNPGYACATGGIWISQGDLAVIDAAPGSMVRVWSTAGEVNVPCQVGDLPQGLFCMPMGPTSNTLVPAATEGTGMPSFKGIKVTVEPSPGGEAEGSAGN
jgi:formylmethanofuran dehydrogenase subunit D